MYPSVDSQKIFIYLYFLTTFLKDAMVLRQVYSLIGGFCGSPVNFHAKDGSGYKFLGEVVLQLDKINPQVHFNNFISTETLLVFFNLRSMLN